MADMNAMRDAQRTIMSQLLGSSAWTKTDGTQVNQNSGLLAGMQQSFSAQIQEMVDGMESNQTAAALKKEQVNSLRFYQGHIKDKNDTVGKVDIYFSAYHSDLNVPPTFDSGAVMANQGLLGNGNGVDGSFTDLHGYAGTVGDRLYWNAGVSWYRQTAYAWNLSNGGITQADAYARYQEEIDQVEADVQSLSTVSQANQVKLNEFSNKYNELQTLASNLSKAFYGIALDIARRFA